MTSITLQSSVAGFAYRGRVRLNTKQDSRSGQSGVIVRILENPSECSRNQWYDVHFDDGTYGRFLERDLTPDTNLERVPDERQHAAEVHHSEPRGH